MRAHAVHPEHADADWSTELEPVGEVRLAAEVPQKSCPRGERDGLKRHPSDTESAIYVDSMVSAYQTWKN